MQNMKNFEYWQGNNETEHHYLTYSENIYVGYKYYETRYEDKMLNRERVGDYDYSQIVQFPFGYGLSYTNFSWSDFKVDNKDEKITMSIIVKKTGTVPGKDVVEFYYQSPYTQDCQSRKCC